MPIIIKLIEFFKEMFYLKKIIYIFGILFLSIVIILNFAFTTSIDGLECVTISSNSFLYIVGLILLGIFIFFIAKFINDKLYITEDCKHPKIRKCLPIIFVLIYTTFLILWPILVRPGIYGDCGTVCDIVQAIYNDNAQEAFLNPTYTSGVSIGSYFQSYPHQITLSFIYNIFLKIIHTSEVSFLRILNVFAVILIMFSLYKINTMLSKKYKTNKVLLFILSLTFFSLPMFSTFIYGDIPSLALCLLAVYFTMKYTDTKKIKYIVFASLLTMVAYMMRMNSLIFVIATVIYLLLNLFNGITKKTWKENLLNSVFVIVYVVISIFPSSLVQNYYLDKYNMDKSKSFPVISYILTGMEDKSYRANGWYDSAISEPALKNPDIKDEYVQRVKDRLHYFSQNIGYTFDFYTKKLASMWTENTYSAITNNANDDGNSFESFTAPLTFYQKTLLIVTCMCSLVVLIQNRKNLSLELIFLITIFIGGFAFHILWEAKSRYIIPYIVILIPVASILITTNFKKLFHKKIS